MGTKYWNYWIWTEMPFQAWVYWLIRQQLGPSDGPELVQEVCKNINAQKGDRDRFFPLWWFLLCFFKIKTCHWSAGRFFASLHGIPCVQFCYLRISQQRTHTVDTTAGNLQWCKQISHYKKFLHAMCNITVTLKILYIAGACSDETYV